MTGFLGQALLYIVPFLLVLTFIVTIHELGHFLVARAFGVKIDRFSIGFGKTIVTDPAKPPGTDPLGYFSIFDGGNAAVKNKSQTNQTNQVNQPPPSTNPGGCYGYCY